MKSSMSSLQAAEMRSFFMPIDAITDTTPADTPPIPAAQAVFVQLMRLPWKMSFSTAPANAPAAAPIRPPRHPTTKPPAAPARPDKVASPSDAPLRSAEMNDAQKPQVAPIPLAMSYAHLPE